ncbi:MAG: glycine cleavage system aminomethyltransferase GcvT [Candidatus Electryonea clarkiae]|nr:glycine cleavage system aminomethyltransferase GcvT [Candidatus Electryonea clarkiae]MDP8287238.1 glycine cleavage system aminomethyltransferase GcvT [Candidatus Electryonea clarkiae]
MEGAKTALYEKHIASGAKMAPFAGYIMPIQYHSINAEHLRVRESAGIFDVSHMGEFMVSGEGALDFINKMTVNNTKKLSIGQAQYSAMLNDNGGIIDDLLVYRFSDHFMIVANAANKAKDFTWLADHADSSIKLADESDNITLLAIQGRNAPAIVQDLTETNIDEIKYYWFAEGEVAGSPSIISRTGYTGEDGVELYFDNKYAENIWDAVLEAGKKYNIEPIGLGARDTLRLEMKFALYGNDIDDTTNTIEAGLGWITKSAKGPFTGREQVLKIKEQGITRKLIGFEIEGKAIPRRGYKCIQGNEKIGDVTSGCWSPSLNKGIGMAYLEKEFTPVGTRFEIEIRNKHIPAVVADTPFYKRPY